MGQKVNPISIRLGIINTWASKWFPPKGSYNKYLHLDIAVRKYLNVMFKGMGVSSIEIKNAAGQITVDIHSAKPGLIIGQQGSKIEELKEKLEKKFGYKFGINVIEVAKSTTDAQIIAESIAQQLERRISYRRAAKAAIDKAMESGAKGIKIRASGRLNGVEIARSEFFSAGRIPLQTFRSDINYALVHANTTMGTIGIKVWVYKGDVFSRQKAKQDHKLA
jgi:small subunit ribosomal protein S3